MKKSEYEKIEAEDFILRIRPYLDKEGTWNGEIDVAIVTQPDNNLDDEDYFQVMHFCKMIASSIPVMELNEDFRELVHDYVVEKVDKHYDVELKNKPKVINQEGNVVQIDFGTNTKGNA
tara:strand:+ start:113 stop:469 length:357 start_codon:yes stop_codon:yes gene_type:complete